MKKLGFVMVMTTCNMGQVGYALEPVFDTSIEVPEDGWITYKMNRADSFSAKVVSVSIADPDLTKTRTCQFSKRAVKCPQLGQVASNDVSGLYEAHLASLFTVIGERVLAVVDSSPSDPAPLKEDRWFFGQFLYGCSLTAEDALTCASLATTCHNSASSDLNGTQPGYTSCSPLHAQQAVHTRGCAGLICECTNENGVVVNDLIEVSEISTGNILCNSEGPGTNDPYFPPSSQSGGCNGVVWEPQCL
ncbi:MAG: hypothetical protein EP330_13795 [Deltaproteobacteria bacterium]|nr:MAG: hypothetical protein EP330_13795 [Deltaproteobacteria bacterium]